MRILFLTPQLPHPPMQGTALRNWGLLSGVARRHEVWLLSFAEPGQGVSAELGAACARVALAPVPARSMAQRLRTLAASAIPDMGWRLYSAQFVNQLRAWLAEAAFDVVQIEGIELARYALELRAEIAASGARIVFDDHNCEYVLQGRNALRDIRRPARWHGAAYSVLQWLRLQRFEQAAMRAASATLCVSAEDAGMLRKLAPECAPVVVPNGIDITAYTPPAAVPAGPPTLVFTGKMDYRPNIEAALWFGQSVFPRIQLAIPDARWLLVGQKPGPRLDVLRGRAGIQITGGVADIRAYVGAADVYVAPLLAGGGTRFKLLEAMAMARAIVSTSPGCEGFAVESGVQMQVADGEERFAAAVIALLRDPGARAALGERGHAYVARQYDWRVIVPGLEAVYARLGLPN